MKEKGKKETNFHFTYLIDIQIFPSIKVVKLKAHPLKKKEKINNFH